MARWTLYETITHERRIIERKDQRVKGKMALGKMAGWVKYHCVKLHWIKWNRVNCHVTFHLYRI